ncbi:MAG: MerR family transcriptional regulator [Lachnospiraceae bacterium]|nr:MerR family transcriptional regulator [Lachnospiraceae bacterium]
MSSVFLISDAARQVKVEAHVLRYWEEELGLPIKRNELGHRYYTEEDVKRFLEIKDMKERGLQLKAIRMVLKNGSLNVLPETPEEENQGHPEPEKEVVKEVVIQEPLQVVSAQEAAVYDAEREEKAKRLQWLLKQLFRETLQENNEELYRGMKDVLLKELDYQFRMQEEKEEERNAEKLKREEEHYKKIDELLRKKRGRIKK